MPRINLLPWREAQRRERQRQFLSMLAITVLIMGALVGYAHYYVGELISYQDSRNAYLQREIAEVNRKIAEIKTLEKERASLVTRMDLIERLQVSRPEVVHLFDEIPRRLPEGVYLTSLKQKGHDVTIEGMAQSNARVSTFMRNLDASPWLTEPRLDVIQTAQAEPERMSRFTLHIKEVAPSATTPESPK